MHVHCLLQMHGIENYAGGSVAHDIFVPRDDASRATRILMEDARKRRYLILFRESQMTQSPVPESRWQQVIIDRPYAAALQGSLRTFPPDIERTLRHSSIVATSNRSPTLAGVRFLRRDYLNCIGQSRPAYEVEVELVRTTPGKRNASSIRFQVWNEGREIRLMGRMDTSEGNSDATAAPEGSRSHPVQEQTSQHESRVHHGPVVP
jgi:hypothetical protein